MTSLRAWVKSEKLWSQTHSSLRIGTWYHHLTFSSRDDLRQLGERHSVQGSSRSVAALKPQR